MSHEPPIGSSLADAHRHATDDVNRWRGRCVHFFAQLEEAAAQTLEALPPPQGSKRAAVFGERIKGLVAMLAASSDDSAAEILDDVQKLAADLAWRNRIVHSTGKIFVDRGGHWLWLWRYQPSKAGAPLEVGTMQQAQGVELEKRLSSQVCSINKRLSNLRGF